MTYLLPVAKEATFPPHGFVRLIDTMPRLVPDHQTMDHAIVQAARVSYGYGTKTVSEDRALIRTLMRDHHTTPFEMVELKFHVKMPVFVARQWNRHRTASINELSGRYSEMKDEFWFPDLKDVRGQGKLNKQSGDEPIDGIAALTFLEHLDCNNEDSYFVYQDSLERGVCREQARTLLPLSLYTEQYWKIDLHNLLHFLRLRMDHHAQKEIRDYADAMYAMIKPLAPWTCEAFNDYRLESITLSRLEIEAIRTGQPLASESKREQVAFADKLKKLGI